MSDYKFQEKRLFRKADGRQDKKGVGIPGENHRIPGNILSESGRREHPSEKSIKKTERR